MSQIVILTVLGLVEINQEWLEVSIQWIGEPECEDQARDLYRISKSTIIGNVHINPELLEKVK